LLNITGVENADHSFKFVRGFVFLLRLDTQQNLFTSEIGSGLSDHPEGT
jgi:hypothetical protein